MFDQLFLTSLLPLLLQKTMTVCRTVSLSLGRLDTVVVANQRKNNVTSFRKKAVDSESSSEVKVR